MEKKFNFVYLTTNLVNGKQYVGDHSTNNLNCAYTKKYLGSGKPYFERAIKEYGKENFKREILEFFSTKKESFDTQEKWINEYNTLVPNGYNLSPKGGLHCAGSISDDGLKRLSAYHKNKVLVKDNNGKLFKVDKNDPKYLGGELVGATKGKTIVKDKNNKTLLMDVDDPRYLNGEYVDQFKDKVLVKDNNGKGYIVNKDNSKYLSGELVGINKGIIFGPMSTDHKNKLSQSHLNLKKIKCVYCNREFDPGNYKQSHGENCKLKSQS